MQRLGDLQSSAKIAFEVYLKAMASRRLLRGVITDLVIASFTLMSPRYEITAFNAVRILSNLVDVLRPGEGA